MRGRIDITADEVARAYREHGSIGRAADALGITRTTAYKRLLESGIERNRRGRPRADISDIARRYLAGETAASIAASLGRSVGSIHHGFWRRGIRKRARKEPDRCD